MQSQSGTLSCFIPLILALSAYITGTLREIFQLADELCSKVVTVFCANFSAAVMLRLLRLRLTVTALLQMLNINITADGDTVALYITLVGVLVS